MPEKQQVPEQIPEWVEGLQEWWKRASKEKRDTLLQDLNVKPQTVYRWMQNENEPDSRYKLTILEQHVPEISNAIRKHFATLYTTSRDLILRMVAPVFARVLQALQKTEGSLILETISSIVLYALVQHLDVEQLGIVVLLGQLKSSQGDGRADYLWINAWSGYGTGPWIEYQADRSYSVGEGSLSAEAVMAGRPLYWSREHQPPLLTHTAIRHLEAIESAAAYPILRYGRVAGIIFLAAAQENYFTSHRREIIEQYALMIPLAFADTDFYPRSHIQFRSDDELQMIAQLVREAQQGDLSDAQIGRQVRLYRQFS